MTPAWEHNDPDHTVAGEQIIIQLASQSGNIFPV